MTLRGYAGATESIENAHANGTEIETVKEYGAVEVTTIEEIRLMLTRRTWHRLSHQSVEVP
jgi:hypothetical protein